MVHEKMLSWFTGKSLLNAQAAVALLDASVAQMGWLPGASRKVRAALGKPNVAVKLGRKHEKELEAIGDHGTPRHQRGWEVAFLLRYGFTTNRAKIDFATVRAGASSDELRQVVDTAERFAAEMAPAYAAMDKLDATRPVPVFTSLGLSPTVTNTLKGLGLDGQPGTLRVCPIEWTQVERKDAKGNTIFVSVGRLKWPAGTVHNRSKHYQSDRNMLCQACGHAIQNAFNWVPLLLDNAAGVPHSLWVGRDCSQKLFGFKVTGEVELEGRQAATEAA